MRQRWHVLRPGGTSFDQRKRASPGDVFLTEEYLARRIYAETQDICRNIAGLSVSPDGVVSLTRGSALLTADRCVPALFIDNITSVGRS